MNSQEFTKEINRLLLDGDFVQCERIIQDYESRFSGSPLYDRVRVERAQKWIYDVKTFMLNLEGADTSLYDILTLSDQSLKPVEAPAAPDIMCRDPGLYLDTMSSVGIKDTFEYPTNLGIQLLHEKGFTRTLKPKDADRYQVMKHVRICNFSRHSATCFNDAFNYNKDTSASLCRRTKVNAAKKPSREIDLAYILPIPYGCRNYYHVTAEMIYGLRHVHRVDSNIPIIYQEDHFKLLPFYTSRLNIKPSRLYRLSDIDDCLIRKCFMPDNVSFFWNEDMFTCFRSLASATSDPFAAVSEKFYISRSLASRQPPMEEKLQSMLAKLGFLIVHTEKMSISDQAALFASANVIVASHGAALTNILFCKPETLLIELFMPNYLNPEYYLRSRSGALKYGLVIMDEQGNYLADVADMLARAQKI